MITWATQSELNNAGFFIKRSQQKDGKFVIVNPTMIAGAGTTAEKQSYTYTDATADPNIVYYYQIEDVSLDGNRQTLTRAHRLKGHVGAAGKATTTVGRAQGTAVNGRSCSSNTEVISGINCSELTLTARWGSVLRDITLSCFFLRGDGNCLKRDLQDL